MKILFGSETPVLTLLVFTGVLAFYRVQAGSRFEYNEQCRKIYKEVFNLRFREAQRLINVEKSLNPENLVPVSIENTKNFLTLFISEDPALFRYYKNTRSNFGKLLEKSNEISPLRRCLLARYHLEWAFAELKFREFYHAVTDLKKAYELLEENKRIYPQFLPDNPGLGILHIILSLVPDKYQWITDLMGMKASFNQGISELESVAFYQGKDELTRLYGNEALFYLTFIKMNFQINQIDPVRAEKMELSLKPSDNSSPLMIYALASLKMKSGNNEEALKILQTRGLLSDAYPFYYLDYLEGVTRLNMLDFKSEDYFNKFLTNFKGTNYRASAMKRLAWIAFLNNDATGYKEWMKRITMEKVLLTDEDRQAQIESEKEIFPSAPLLKARLFFDGGYYLKALNELSDFPVSSDYKTPTLRLEYNYRSGRIYQMLGNESSSINYFQNVIESGENSGSWFPAAAAVQLGTIYESRLDYSNAAKYYKICLSENNSEYRNSLRQKAKIGLARVKMKTKT